MGVGGPARWFVVAESLASLGELVRVLKASGAPWMMLGGGSNTIFGDKGYAGVVVTLGRAFREIAAGPGEHQITAGAAATLSALMNFSKRQGLTGLEFTGGIPGNLGGALAGNAGTAAGEVCPITESVEVLDTSSAGEQSSGDSGAAFSNTRVIKRGDFNFRYRWSDLREQVVVRATLQLAPGDPAVIQTGIDAALGKRWEQPIGLRCSGCMFKNPEGDYAGRLIDQSGLKGLRVGGASVSDQHANFMINDGTATAADLAALIEEVRQKVAEKTGVKLDLEVRIVELDSASELH